MRIGWVFSCNALMQMRVSLCVVSGKCVCESELIGFRAKTVCDVRCAMCDVRCAMCKRINHSKTKECHAKCEMSRRSSSVLMRTQTSKAKTMLPCRSAVQMRLAHTIPSMYIFSRKLLYVGDLVRGDKLYRQCLLFVSPMWPRNRR